MSDQPYLVWRPSAADQGFALRLQRPTQAITIATVQRHNRNAFQGVFGRVYTKIFDTEIEAKRVVEGLVKDLYSEVLDAFNSDQSFLD
jgi:hypothetical protein